MAITDVIDINFQLIDTKDPKWLNIADYSTWGMIENKPAIIEVTLPGFKNPVTNYFKMNQINAFNSLHLGINCVDSCGNYEKADLPDGVYEITVKGSPDSYNFSRKVLRTTLLELQLDKAYVNAVSSCSNVNQDLLNRIDKVEAILSAAHSNVVYDNICEAQELYKEAKRLTDNLKECDICADAGGR